MGAAPSTELLEKAPFRPPHGGLRQIALIPFTTQFFPSPHCPLFEQLYEARMDPSVRYYLRYEETNLRRDRIPPISATREELYNLYLASGRFCYASNDALRSDYYEGKTERIRPVPCAVVFLYDTPRQAPDGSVRLTVGVESIHVKVIGAVGDVRRIVDSRNRLLPQGTEDAMHIQMYITKSAGDHNMARVMLLAAYVFQHQCIHSIGLPTVPTPSACFMSLKTNIPFLCFLRELRGRTANILEVPERPPMWLDNMCIRGFVPAHYVAKMCIAFSEHYMEFLEAKAGQRAHRLGPSSSAQGSSQRRQSYPGDGGTVSDRVRRLGGYFSSGFASPHDCDGSVPLALEDPGRPQAPASLTHHPFASATIIGGNRRLTKIDFSIKGYITQSRTTIPNVSEAPNEVYIVCADSTVRVMRSMSIGSEITCPSSTPGVTPLSVRGAPESVNAEHQESDGGLDDDEDLVEVHRVRRGDIIAFRETSTSPAELRKRHAPADGTPTDGNAHADFPRSGRWEIDPTTHLESVLLSLVQDECRSAREADEDDPRWVHDDEHNCPVHDGNFYIWHFQRGQETFYYGTVPKFANPTKRKAATASTTAVSRKGDPCPIKGRAGVQTDDAAGSSDASRGAMSSSDRFAAPPSYDVAVGGHISQRHNNDAALNSIPSSMHLLSHGSQPWVNNTIISVASSTQTGSTPTSPLTYVVGPNGPMLATTMPTIVPQNTVSSTTGQSQQSSTRYVMMGYPPSPPQPRMGPTSFMMSAMPSTSPNALQPSCFAFGPSNGSIHQHQPVMFINPTDAGAGIPSMIPNGFAVMPHSGMAAGPGYVMLGGGHTIQGSYSA